ncbi:MAG: hypothetical protein ACP5OR_02220 [Candidatus Dormibacteria bacterium]
MTFDLAKYKFRSQHLVYDDLPWENVPDTHLDEEAINALGYMMDIEGYTSVYLSQLLVSGACLEPTITGFLHVWAYEEMYHSDALRKFLESYGVAVPDSRARDLRMRTNGMRMLNTAAIMIASRWTTVFPAIYLTIGAANELTTLTGYERLAEQTRHPVLAVLLARIVKQERQHYAFYRWKASEYLGASRLARVVTRRYLQNTFVAVGDGAKSKEEIYRLARYLFAGDEGLEAARAIDEEIAKLPGLADLGLLERTVNHSRIHGGAATAVVTSPYCRIRDAA